MLSFLPGPVRGVISYLIYFINTVFWCIPLYPAIILKLLIPLNRWKSFWNIVLNKISNSWISVNNFNISLTKKIRWDIRGFESLNLKLSEWYLVLSNHQSWTDILILQKIFKGKIPFLKFFIKKELIWMPILGLAWWGLDFPFMKRYSKAHLKLYPQDKGRDIEMTKKACEKFKYIPTSIMNFVEGTRFSPEKRDAQKSPYINLMKPKAGGIALVMNVMGDKLNQILDVTIAYPQNIRTFWGFLSGKVTDVIIKVESIPVPKELIGNYDDNEENRKKFQDWVNALWAKKDRDYSLLIESAGIS